MIVPRNRLLVFTGLAAPLGALAWAEPSALIPAGLPVLVFAFVAVMDAVLALGRLDGVRIVLPEVIRMTKDREAGFQVSIENEPQRIRRLRIGLAFPRGIRSLIPDLLADLPAESATSALSWPCRAERRGKYRLDSCYLETASALKLWAVRRSAEVDAEIRVFPNVFVERKHLSALFLGRGLAGIHAQRQVGKGRDFEQLREYSPGDSYEDVHWKATAKRGFPITKVFQVERTQEVYVVIDASRLSARNAHRVSEHRLAARAGDAPNTTILERFITAALVVGMAAERQGDLFGLMTFSDRVHHLVRAKNGKPHYNACRESLYTLQPRIVSPDYDEVFTFIGSRLRRRALLVFLTSMDDPVLAEGFARHVHLISKRHLVLVNMIRPPLAEPLFSSDRVQRVDDVYRALGGHYQWAGLRETERVLKQKNVAFAALDNEWLSASLVTRYLGVKRRQAL